MISSSIYVFKQRETISLDFADAHVISDLTVSGVPKKTRFHVEIAGNRESLSKKGCPNADLGNA